MPVPQENSLFVEQAGKPVLEQGARCNFYRIKQQKLTLTQASRNRLSGFTRKFTLCGTGRKACS